MTLETAALNARDRAASTGRRHLIWHEDGHPGYGVWSVDNFDADIDHNLPFDAALRVVAVVHPSGACNFVEAE